ncbi:hypothetical protein V5O48_019247, partial [Marasmius crinis-equi]
RARKLTPKFIGPFRILKELEPGATYKLELSNELKQKGINPSFHASLLRIHIPNDDRRFPGRQFHQIPGFGGDDLKWAVDRILSHSGKGRDAMFEVKWAAGDTNWLAYREVCHLVAFDQYCEAMGISKVSELPEGTGNAPEFDEIPTLEPEEGFNMVRNGLNGSGSWTQNHGLKFGENTHLLKEGVVDVQSRFPRPVSSTLNPGRVIPAAHTNLFPACRLVRDLLDAIIAVLVLHPAETTLETATETTDPTRTMAIAPALHFHATTSNVTPTRIK